MEGKYKNDMKFQQRLTVDYNIFGKNGPLATKTNDIPINLLSRHPEAAKNVVEIKTWV